MFKAIVNLTLIMTAGFLPGCQKPGAESSMIALRKVVLSSGHATAVSADSTSDSFVACVGKSLVEIDLVSGKEVGHISYPGTCEAVLARQGRLTVLANGEALYYSAGQGEFPGALQKRLRLRNGLSFVSRDGRYVIDPYVPHVESVLQESAARVIDLADGSVVGSIPLALSRAMYRGATDGQGTAIATRDGEIYWWSPMDTKKEPTRLASVGIVKGVWIMAAGSKLAVASGDFLSFLATDSGKLTGLAKGVVAGTVCVDKAGKSIAAVRRTGASSWTVNIWDVSGNLLAGTAEFNGSLPTAIWFESLEHGLFVAQSEGVVRYIR